MGAVIWLDLINLWNYALEPPIIYIPKTLCRKLHHYQISHPNLLYKLLFENRLSLKLIHDRLNNLVFHHYFFFFFIIFYFSTALLKAEFSHHFYEIYCKYIITTDRVGSVTQFCEAFNIYFHFCSIIFGLVSVTAIFHVALPKSSINFKSALIQISYSFMKYH